MMTSPKMRRVDTPLARVIQPIVEGQIRDFLNQHPQIAEAVDWRHSHATKKDALVSSIAKRLSRDLCCPDTERRIRAALEPQTGEAGVEVGNCPNGHDGLEIG